MCQAINQHNHEFSCTLDVKDSHTHRISGMTGPAVKAGDGHVHEVLLNFTSFNGFHLHYLSFLTGLSIKISEFEHVHLCQGISSSANGQDGGAQHTHSFHFYTSAGPNALPREPLPGD
ncbi:MAG: YmaF family protein [Bacillota bacterium]